MPNPIKYSTSPQTLALKKGNFWIGTGDSDKGPSVSSGYYAGITPPEGGGYTIYLSNPGGDYNMVCPTNDTQLLSFTASQLGQTFATGPSALAWFATQSDKMVTNIDYPNLVTNNLALNLDAGFISSYPRGGTSWYDLGPSGNNGALINGPTYSTSYLGSIVFDGVDDSVVCGKNPSTLFSSMTISSWFSFNSYTDQTHIIIGRLGAGPGFNHNYFFGLQQKKFYFGFKNANDLDYPLVWIPNINPTIGVAYQFTATYSTTNSVKLYLNGSPRSFSGPNTSINPLITNQSVKQDLANTTCAIGSGYGQGSDFFSNANVYTAQLYSRVLSESEILLNYQSTFPRFLGQNIVTNGMLEYLNAGYSPSYGGTGTTWTNVAGVSGGNGTLTNGPTYATGNGGAIVFDGTDDYVTIPTFSIPVGSFSCEAFFQWSNLGTSRGSIFSLNYDYPNSGYLIRQKDDGSGKFVVWSDYGSESGIFSNAALLVNTWNHVIVVQNSGICRIYINGILDSSQSLPNPVLSQNFPILLGVRATSGPSVGAYFPGKISFSKIYNRTLSGSEVLQNYQASLPQILAENIVTSGMVAYWDAGYATSYPGSGTSWNNVSGIAGATGTLTNGPTYSSLNGGSILFDGTDDFVQTDYSGILGTNPRTFSIWFKPDVTQTKNLLGYGTAENHKMWDILLYQGNVGVHLYNSGAEAGTPYSVGVWQNITFTFTYPTIKSYMNGVYKNSYTSNLINTGSNIKLNLCKGAYFDFNFFDGGISIVQIYNRELSQSEVLQNYNAQKSRFGL